MVHAEIADDVVVERVEVEHGEEVHRLVLLHVDHLHRAVLDRIEEVTASLVRRDDDLPGLAGLGDRADDARAGLGVEAHHAGQVRMALNDRGRVRRDLLDVGARLLVGHDLHVRAFLGQRITQALAGGDEVAGGEERDGADLTALQARIGVVAALVLTMLIAEVVPVGAEIGETLGHRQVTVGDHGRDLLVDALVHLGSQRVIPATDDNHAGRILGALSIDRGDEGSEVDGGRPGDAHLDVQRLARRLEPWIDPLDEQRQVRGVADPDIFLVAAAGVANRDVQPGRTRCLRIGGTSHGEGRERGGEGCEPSHHCLLVLRGAVRDRPSASWVQAGVTHGRGHVRAGPARRSAAGRRRRQSAARTG
jgi:hypothetical protein